MYPYTSQAPFGPRFGPKIAALKARLEQDGSIQSWASERGKLLVLKVKTRSLAFC